jgi:CheY-like chemotaxis protein
LAAISRAFEAFPELRPVYTYPEMRGLILIVDDNPIDLKLTSALLGVEGYEVEAAVDAEQAQLLLRRMVPDLMVVDIALPGMDGLTLTRLVKGDPRLAHVPVVALTAFAKRGDVEQAAAAGCARYLTKPVDLESFAEDIAETLAASRVRRREPLRAD